MLSRLITVPENSSLALILNPAGLVNVILGLPSSLKSVAPVTYACLVIFPAYMLRCF